VGWMNIMRGSGRAFTMQCIHDETSCFLASKQACSGIDLLFYC
jgi:hypothetical protein